MSNICGRASSGKVTHTFNEESKTTKKSCSVNKVTADSKHFNHFSKRDGHHKVKRLKTRKERSQMRSGWKETSKTKSFHHRCNHHSRTDMAYFQNCCHNSWHRTSRKNAPISSSVSALQEPSIITDSRLIGHHGLFNHEVKSSDIERLLSKPRKHEQIGQHVEEKSSDVLHPSTSHIPVLLSTESLLDADDVLPLKKKVHPDAKSHNDDQESEVNNDTLNNQGSNITSGQNQEQLLDLSSGNCKSNLSCKYSLLNVETAVNNNSVPSEKDRESQLTPLAGPDNMKTLSSQVRRNMISDLEQPYKNRDHNTQMDGFNPNPLSLSSSPTADSCSIQQDPECVSKSISTLATKLCGCLHLPLLKRRSILSESRKVLLKSLQERHGSSLQANLREVQQSVRFGMHPTLAIKEKESRMMEEEEILSSGTRMDTSDFFNWKSSPQPLQNPQQTAEWMANPVDTSASLMYEPLMRFSPRFYMDFEQAGSLASGLSAHSPTSYQEKKASASDNWEDPFCKSKSEESVLFDSFKDSFMSHPGEVRERGYTSHYHCRNIQPFFPFQAQPSDGNSVKPMPFIQEQDPFGTDRYSFAPSFPACIDHPPQRNHFQPFSQTSTSTFFTTSHADMLHYPPSHMLESRPAPPRSSLLSPDHWSFPPMRLY